MLFQLRGLYILVYLLVVEKRVKRRRLAVHWEYQEWEGNNWLRSTCLTCDLWLFTLSCFTGTKMDEADKYKQRLEAIAVSPGAAPLTRSAHSFEKR